MDIPYRPRANLRVSFSRTQKMMYTNGESLQIRRNGVSK
jgi:hypothetical protein